MKEIQTFIVQRKSDTRKKLIASWSTCAQLLLECYQHANLHLRSTHDYRTEVVPIVFLLLSLSVRMAQKHNSLWLTGTNILIDSRSCKFGNQITSGFRIHKGSAKEKSQWSLRDKKNFTPHKGQSSHFSLQE